VEKLMKKKGRGSKEKKGRGSKNFRRVGKLGNKKGREVRK
jgi:hypothetical protein